MFLCDFHQAVWQLLPTICSKKRSKSQPFSENEIKQIKEIELLWLKCTDASHVLSLAAVGVFIELVSQNILNFSYVMNGFLSRVPSTRHFLGPIHGVTQLLCLQMKSAIPPSPSYSLRSTPHPYISILANSSEAWVILCQEIENLFVTFQDSSLKSVFMMFDPFFKYVFFNPKSDYVMCRSLHSLLMNVASELSPVVNQDVLDSILILVKNHVSLCTKNVKSVGHNVSLCHHTLQWLLAKDETLFEKHLKAFTIVLLELCHEQLLIGIPVSSSLVLLNKITNVKPWAVITNGSTFSISHLLLTCSEYYLQQLVKIASNICNYIIASRPSDTIKLSFLVLPLLQILTTSHHSVINKSIIESLSAKLLTGIEKALQGEYAVGDFNGESSTVEVF